MNRLPAVLKVDPHAKIVFKRAVPKYISIKWQLTIASVVAVACTIVGAFCAVAVAGITQPTPTYIVCLIHPFMWALYTGLSVIMSITAASLSNTTADREAFQLLSLSNMTGRAMFQGYFLASLYRLRSALMFVTSLIPFLVLLPLGNVLGWITDANGLRNIDLMMAIYPAFTPIRMCGIVLYAASIGTGVGMDYSSPSQAMIIALAQIVSYIIINALLLLPFTNLSINYLDEKPLLMLLLVGLLITLTVAPYLLTINAFYRKRSLRRGAFGSRIA